MNASLLRRCAVALVDASALRCLTLWRRTSAHRPRLGLRSTAPLTAGPCSAIGILCGRRWSVLPSLSNGCTPGPRPPSANASASCIVRVPVALTRDQLGATGTTVAPNALVLAAASTRRQARVRRPGKERYSAHLEELHSVVRWVHPGGIETRHRDDDVACECRQRNHDELGIGSPSWTSPGSPCRSPSQDHRARTRRGNVDEGGVIGLGGGHRGVRVLGSSPRSPPNHSPGPLRGDRNLDSETTTSHASGAAEPRRLVSGWYLVAFWTSPGSPACRLRRTMVSDASQ